MSEETTYDIVIIGGGINGCGIARDAAGRGLKVLLAEQDDIASATSGWSTKLIHGGLRYLEQYAFRLVRESLQEREVLLRLAPHIIHPLAFVLPHEKSMRPAWLIRAGLFLYDHIGGKISLPTSRGVTFPDDEFSAGLRLGLKRGFIYSDARVDDARLTVLNAMSAREHGAKILTRIKVESGARENRLWHLKLADQVTGEVSYIHAKAIVNAAGPWVQPVLEMGFEAEFHEMSARTESRNKAAIKLVKGSHIIVPRLHDEAHAYLLQNDDGRIVFVIPYEDRFSLIGTTDVAVANVKEGHAIGEAEITYLLRVVNRFFQRRLLASDIVWTYAGVRPLYNDGHAKASEITRDYVLKVNDDNGALPILSIYGGKITTYRRLAEHALDELKNYFPTMPMAWTSTEALPGGAIPAGTSLAEFVQAKVAQYCGLPPDYIDRLVKRHGINIERVLKQVKRVDDLGELFGRGRNMLAGVEIEYLIHQEWARTAEDILWRRTKCGLHMDQEERQRAAVFIERRVKQIVRQA